MKIVMRYMKNEDNERDDNSHNNECDDDDSACLIIFLCIMYHINSHIQSLI